MENTSKLQSGTCATSLLELSSSNEDVIQQRINHIRMELDETYNIFVNAQSTLSSISFENLGESLNSTSLRHPEVQTSSSTEGIQITPEITLVHDGNNRVDVSKSLEQLNCVPKETQHTKAAEEIPELTAFFKVIRDLTEGIKKISSHQQSITELNQDINTLGEPTPHQSGSSSLTSLSSRLADMSLD
uniref:Uncharacterized protein n=1 Tax=Anopheles funestus TaxID=62324 RepID=A0A4Y0BKV6_ANOFN